MKHDFTAERKDRNLYVTDTTLRDGEQAAGVVFSIDEKVEIAYLLDQVGVDEIEVGIPAMNNVEIESIKRIIDLKLNSKLIGWNRANKEDIKKSIDCGLTGIHIGFPVSDLHIKERFGKDRNWILENITETIEFAKSQKLYVSCSGEDASRADPDFLIEYAKTIKAAGADRIRVSDTVGHFNPLDVYKMIRLLVDEVGIDIESHTHNDFGMATANVIAAVCAGATHAQGTVMGIGERAGNGSLEEIIMALKYICGFDLKVETRKLKDLVNFVAKAAGRTVPNWKPIVGEDIFAHESGIHVSAGLKANHLFEPFAPEDVNLERKLVIGKHSGTAGIIHKLGMHGIKITTEEAYVLLEEVRQFSLEHKRALTDNELLQLANKVNV
ncbi:homoaconitate hydratase [Paenibacillus glacialis]|uniref:Homoaconitate hydratase n=2 Tax=Paenibacillus glacialis TaxID=494026 RepID=A0A162LTU3_9BACL|nr:homoaconitate hydratase [Paenibacillus glacialis]